MFDMYSESAAKYGKRISSALSGKTVTKKREDAEKPGGLVYEAKALEIDPWYLLEALEGMRGEGKASMVDDMTYLIK